jgi:hypothetical protein
MLGLMLFARVGYRSHASHGIAVLAALLFIVPAVPAAADLTSPPEVPPGGVEFTDNPDIVDPQPIRVESWSRTADDHAVAVHFTLGPAECYGVHATTRETTETVTVELRSGTPPEAVGRMCIMIALFGTLDVPLQQPLGDRRVLAEY